MHSATRSRPLPGRIIFWFNQVATALEQGFGSPFEMFAKEDDWGSVLGADSRNLPDVCGATFDECCRTMRPCVTEVGEISWLIVPVNESGVSLVAAGEVAAETAPLAVPLAAALVTNLKQQQQLSEMSQRLRDYACQVTSDFEELTWLRSLAEHTDVCDSRHDVTTIARATLPGLYEMIGAEAILLYTASDAGILNLACRIGDAVINSQTGMDLIDQFANQTMHQPVVSNAPTIDGHLDSHGDVRNCIVARLAKGQRHFGWLVAVNKRQSDELDRMDSPIAAGLLSDWEFGTLEAGLLNSAAIMLAAHANNNDSFRQIEQLLVGVIRALINAIDARDAYTCGHSDRVASIAKRIARKMELPAIEQERIYMAGLLHDVGKIGVPDQVLGKAERLTDEEFACIKRHPEIGVAILKHLRQLSYVLPGVLHHHESIDGRGYPHGLAGDAIPLFARILAVADAYDAMTSTRPYRQAMSTAKAELILKSGAGKQWDAEVVHAFFQCIEEVYRISGFQRATCGEEPAYGAAEGYGSGDEIAQAVMATLT